jgi:hypothetical protein
MESAELVLQHARPQDGGRRDLLKTVSHRLRAKIINSYTTFPRARPPRGAGSGSRGAVRKSATPTFPSDGVAPWTA